MYEAVDLFRNRCLGDGRSFLWPGHHAWSPENISALLNAITGENADTGGRTFYQKLHDQLVEQPEEVHRVATDVMAFYYLFPTKIGLQKKLAYVKMLAGWKLDQDQPELDLLKRAYAASVGDAGMLYNTRQPEQVIFYLEFAREILSGGIDPADVIACKRVADAVKERVRSSNPARNIVLHLLFPERFERIAADVHKRRIMEAFRGRSGGAQDVDEALESIRRSLSGKYGEDFDFYDENILWQWQDTPDGDGAPSVQRYVDAFRAAGDLPDSYLKMLRAHYAAPDRTTTATRLARAVGYPNYNSSNLNYPRVGGLVGQHLGWRPGMPLKVLVTFENREGEWHWIMRPQVVRALEVLGWVTETDEREDGSMQLPERGPLNLILYGPPGTGKTYHTQRRALEVLDPDLQGISDSDVASLYREYLNEGRIEFVTFHPSYSYEEFVEGYRYDEDAGVPTLHRGIFRQIVNRALNPRQTPTVTEGARIWKVSLGGSPEPHIFERCMESGEIAVGWLGDRDLTSLDREAIAELFGEYGSEGATNSINSVNYLVNGIRDGDYVAILKNQREIRAIGLVTGAYRYRGDEYGEDYPHTRPVEWLDRRDHDIYEMNGATNLTLTTIYSLNRISLQDFVGLLPEQEQAEEPYVLIIDEINRGNLSRIFGELVTLLEEDKRRGAENELSARLPYSLNTFTVPSNLYVIGTMNTADRSIALLDTALRRRFEFREMMPDVNVLRRVLLAKVEEEASEHVELVCEVFEALNRRVAVLLDRDHQIGHSYFLGSTSTEELHRTLYRRVFPLLQEYFYNDAERMRRLLGGHDASAKRGFFAYMEEYRRAFDEGVLEDELPWELHEYPVEDLEEALRSTFLSG